MGVLHVYSCQDSLNTCQVKTVHGLGKPYIGACRNYRWDRNSSEYVREGDTFASRLRVVLCSKVCQLARFAIRVGCYCRSQSCPVLPNQRPAKRALATTGTSPTVGISEDCALFWCSLIDVQASLGILSPLLLFAPPTNITSSVPKVLVWGCEYTTVSPGTCGFRECS